MRPCLGIIIALAVCAGGGCRETMHSLSPTALMERMRGGRPAANSDLPQVQVALIRQPLGDRYLNDDLWYQVDENVAPEKKPIYAANGFRLGTISGTLPAELHRLLTNDKTCIHSRLVTVQSGKWFFMPLGQGDQVRDLDLHQDGEVIQAKFEKAQCGFGLRIDPADDGRTILQFEPRIQHGSSQIIAKPAEDRSRIMPVIGRPEEKYPKLAFEIDLDANEYLIIGAALQPEKSLGRACLTQPEPETNAQYLLVIRGIPTKHAASKPAVNGAMPDVPAVPLAIQSLAPPSATKPSNPYAIRGRMP